MIFFRTTATALTCSNLLLYDAVLEKLDLPIPLPAKHS
jgi:hypothetical protein